MLHLLVSLAWKNTEKKSEGNKTEECLVAGHCYDCSDVDLSISGHNLHYPVRPLVRNLWKGLCSSIDIKLLQDFVYEVCQTVT